MRNAIEGNHLKHIRLKISTTQIFFILLRQSDNELPFTEMQKNWGITYLVFKTKRMENYSNFNKSVLETQHGLSGC